jgi:ribosomal protein S20
MNYDLFTDNTEYQNFPSRYLLLFRAVCDEYGLQFSSLIQSCKNLGIRISLEESSQNGIAVTIPKNILEGEYVARGYLDKEIRSYTPEILLYLNNQRDEELSDYIAVLKTTYANPIHDDWHGDGMPKKFRTGTYTDNEMKTAVAKFKERIHSQEKDPACLAFEKAQTALLEYQDYINTQNILQHNPANDQVHRDSVVKWKAYVKAYESLPEYQDLIAAQERIVLLASLNG